MPSPIVRLKFAVDNGLVVTNSGTYGDGEWFPSAGTIIDSGDPDRGNVAQGISGRGVRFPDVANGDVFKQQAFEFGFWIKPSTTNVAFTHIVSTKSYTGTSVKLGWSLVTSGTSLLWNCRLSGGSYYLFWEANPAYGSTAPCHIAFKIKDYVVYCYKNGVIYRTVPFYANQPIVYETITRFYYSGIRQYSAVPDIDQVGTLSNVSWVDDVYYYDQVLTEDERFLQIFGYVPIRPKFHVFTEATIPLKRMILIYRLEKGQPLTDLEIDDNFILSDTLPTPIPTFSGGFVTNHTVGNIYFGITVTDATGAYTGSGDCFMWRNGYKPSEIGFAPS